MYIAMFGVVQNKNLTNIYTSPCADLQVRDGIFSKYIAFFYEISTLSPELLCLASTSGPVDLYIYIFFHFYLIHKIRKAHAR